MFNITVPRITLNPIGEKTKAFADVRIDSEIGSLEIKGFPVIESDGMPPWVGLPSKPGKQGKKWFPVIEWAGDLKTLIVNAILDAYDKMNKK